MADADVVVDNFRAARGATWTRRRTRAGTISGPRLVHHLGFGPTSKRLGYDFVAQAECGSMAITGAPEGTPVKVGVALANVLAGKDATIAVLAALVHRASTGRGQHVTTSLAGSATAALVNVAQNALVTGEEPQRWGNAHANLVPYELFSTADRPIVIAVGNDAQWLSCAAALDLPESRHRRAIAHQRWTPGAPRRADHGDATRSFVADRPPTGSQRSTWAACPAAS